MFGIPRASFGVACRGTGRLKGSVNAKEALIALNLIENVGPVRLRHLLDHLGDPVAILQAGAARLQRIPGIGPETAEAIAAWESTTDLAGEVRRIEQFGCAVITLLEPEYPALLREIYDPPIVLYVRGRLSASDRNAMAIVGSRQTTSYGQDVARRLGYQLAHLGVTVVSGGARGIDTAAHRGTLAAKGRTICVLGTGPNRVFPPENAELFDRIAEHGAVITQFPFDRPADKQSFPIRNRIVAGMTLGTVVVEANLASGAMITAKFAADYNRQVFAVPGRIDSPRSKGCHDLLKKGAKLCEGPEDILGEFEYLFPPSSRPASPAETGVVPALALSETEARVLECLGAEPQSIDQLIRRTSLPPAVISVTLLGLEMKRLVTQWPGKQFTRRGAEDR